RHRATAPHQPRLPLRRARHRRRRGRGAPSRARVHRHQHLAGDRVRLIARVLTTLLREDHLGMHTDGEPVGDRWRWRHLRLPIEPDGFLARYQVSAGFLEERGRRLSTLDEILTALAPSGDPEAERGWAAFTEECHAAAVVERLHAARRPGLRAELAPLD